MICRTTLFSAVAVFFLFTTNSFSQVVTSGADDGSDGTLRQEIADTPSGGTITFDGVTTVTLTSELVIDKSLRITGPLNAGVLSLTIDANFQGRSFNVTNGTVELDDLIITNGVEENGGAIYVTNADLLVNNSRITGNVANGTGSPAGSGGGIFVDEGAVLTVTDTEMSSNQANRAGGAIEDNSGAGPAITLNNVDFINNNAGAAPASALPGNGGAVHITGAGDISITGGSVIDNVAGKEGGGLWNGSGTMTVVGVDIQDNMAIGNETGGGGIFNLSGTVSIDATTTLTGNIAMGDTPGGRGGAIFNNTNGVLNLASGLSITGNYASRAGGAIEDASGGTLSFTGVTITGNAAGVDIGLGNTITANPGNGGAIHLSGTTNADIASSIIEDNLAALEGGGLWNNLGTMTVDNTTLDNNTASGDDADTGGGGIFNNGGTLVVKGASTITNNVASGTSGSGGGIMSIDGSVTIQDANTVVNSNISNRAGGGIEIIDGSLAMINVNLNGNNTGVSPAIAAPGNGGGLHVSGTAAITINGGTISNNLAASEGGGVWNQVGSNMTLTDLEMDENIASGDAADNGGGAIFNNGGVTNLNEVIVTANVADGISGSGGAALSIGGELNIVDSQIVANISNRAGGGIEIAGGEMNMTDTILNGNNTGLGTAVANPGNGGGLHVTGSANINITGGTTNNNLAANEGGGLWNGSGVMTLMNHDISQNTAAGNDSSVPGAAGGGGIYNEGGTVDMSGASFVSENIASGAQSTGGGILNAGGILIADETSILDNVSNRAGGGIEVNGDGSVSLLDVVLNGNETGLVTGPGAPGNGGGLHVTGASTVNITGGTVNNNIAATEGGGLWNGTGTMTLDGLSILQNSASGADADNGGGGIFNLGGTLIVQNNSFVNENTADGASGSGGGLLSLVGDVTISDSRFDDNSANRAGGAIEIVDGNLDFTNSVMSNNDVDGAAGTPNPGSGGGVHVTGTSGTVNIMTSTITNNAAANQGGALWNQDGTTMNVMSSTIDNNSAAVGGGIYNKPEAITNVMTSTITMNMATADGGGVFRAPTGTTGSLNINASTIATNSATNSGGGINGANEITIKNSIVALNTAGSGTDVAGTVTSNDYNLIGTDDLDVFDAQANDIEGADPLVGPLQDNGGTTLTHALLDNSPAFNAGDPADTFADQIGQAVFGNARDIGAFEAQSTLSINGFGESNITSVYPNPTTGKFNIEIANTISQDIRLQIIDINGRLVKERQLSTGLNPINISGINSGIYILSFTSGSNKVTHKLILD